jgi:anti-repressor protein
MGADLIQHAFHGHAVRVVTDEHGEPMFVLADLCAILGLSSPTRVAERIDPDALSLAQVIDTMGRSQTATVVTEAGMYEVVIRSDKPDAREFRRWVTTDVLPAIRRTGSYGSPSFDLTSMDDVALLLAAATNALTRVRELEPPAAAWNLLVESSGDYSMRDTAQILSRDPDIEIGQNRLAKYLRQIGWIDYRGIPYQHHVDVGRLSSKPQTRVSNRTGERVTCDPQVRITLKGLGALHKLLGGTAPVATGPAYLAVVA